MVKTCLAVAERRQRARAPDEFVISRLESAPRVPRLELDLLHGTLINNHHLWCVVIGAARTTTGWVMFSCTSLISIMTTRDFATKTMYLKVVEHDGMKPIKIIMIERTGVSRCFINGDLRRNNVERRPTPVRWTSARIENCPDERSAFLLTIKACEQSPHQQHSQHGDKHQRYKQAVAGTTISHFHRKLVWKSWWKSQTSVVQAAILAVVVRCLQFIRRFPNQMEPIKT